MIDATVTSQIELVGVPVRGLTLDHRREPGRALSREKAKDMRDELVTQAIPQKNWATAQMRSSPLPRLEPAASMKIWAGGSPMSVVRSASQSCTAKVTASRSTQPAPRETMTELTMPLGAATEALRVSSATWAEAS